MDQRAKLGQRGEKVAEKFLRRKGYRIRARRYRTRFGEIDLIAQHKNSIVFIEVRTLSSDRHGSAFEALSHAKKQHVLHTAKEYLYNHRLMDREHRFDFIQVLLDDTTPPKIEHIENAF